MVGHPKHVEKAFSLGVDLVIASSLLRLFYGQYLNMI
jgi:hypothetical protein